MREESHAFSISANERYISSIIYTSNPCFIVDNLCSPSTPCWLLPLCFGISSYFTVYLINICSRWLNMTCTILLKGDNLKHILFSISVFIFCFQFHIFQFFVFIFCFLFLSSHLQVNTWFSLSSKVTQSWTLRNI